MGYPLAIQCNLQSIIANKMLTAPVQNQIHTLCYHVKHFLPQAYP